MKVSQIILARMLIDDCDLHGLFDRMGSFGRPAQLAEFTRPVAGLREPEALALFALLFCHHWSSCDGVTQHLVDLRTTFKKRHPNWWRCGLMTSQELEAFRRLPRKFTVYRGCRKADDTGISWTLNRDVARKFPFYPRYLTDGDPVLLTGQIERKDALALKMDRGEDEIIMTARPKNIIVERLTEPVSTSAA